MRHPDQLATEYRRRLEGGGRLLGREPDDVQGRLRPAKRALARLIDGYAEGLLTTEEATPRLERFRQRIAALEEQLEQQHAQEIADAEVQLIVGRLVECAARVRTGLDKADQQTQRAVILALVKRVEVDGDRINVVFRITPGAPSPDGRSLRYCPECALGLEGEVKGTNIPGRQHVRRDLPDGGTSIPSPDWKRGWPRCVEIRKPSAPGTRSAPH